jgi:hypothetical protein
MNKRRKILLVALLTVIFAVALSGVWFFVFPNVDYWLDTNYHYTKEGQNWVTINRAGNTSGTFMPITCMNGGLMTVTFQVTILFSGATFSTQTALPYEQISANSAKFTFTLASLEQKKVDVYFSIQNDTAFSASLSISSGQLLNIASPQHLSGQAWDISYRELHYYNSGNWFYPAVIS